MTRQLSDRHNGNCDSDIISIRHLTIAQASKTKKAPQAALNVQIRASGSLLRSRRLRSREMCGAQLLSPVKL